MDIFQAKNSSEILSLRLKDSSGKRPRGIVQKLAKALRCHPSFVSQLILGRSLLSSDQAVRCSEFLGLEADETEFFLTMLNRDRASSKDARRYFEERMREQLEKRANLKHRLGKTESLSPEKEARYYENWSLQVLHMLCQCSGPHTLESLKSALGLSRIFIDHALAELVSLGLVKSEGGRFTAGVDNLHLAQGSPFLKRLHTVWRIKTIELMAASPLLPGTHFSSVIASDDATMDAIRELWIRFLSESRQLIMAGKAEKIAVFCFDFYPFQQDKNLR